MSRKTSNDFVTKLLVDVEREDSNKGEDNFIA